MGRRRRKIQPFKEIKKSYIETEEPGESGRRQTKGEELSKRG